MTLEGKGLFFLSLETAGTPLQDYRVPSYLLKRREAESEFQHNEVEVQVLV